MHSSTSSFRQNVAVSVGLTSIAIAIFLSATEVLVRTKVAPAHNLSKYVQLFRSSTTGNAIFGDSHFAYGVTAIPQFVNMAYQGNNFASIDEKVRLYFAHRRPQKVILQAGVHHFSDDFVVWKEKKRETFAAAFEPRSFMLPLMLAPEHRAEVFNYWKIFLSGRDFTPVERFMPDGSRMHDQNYATFPERTRAAAAQRTALIFQPRHDFRKSETAELYGRTLDWLRERGGNVCLVTLPVFSLLRDQIRDNPRYDAAIAFFGEIAFQRGVRYLNLLLLELPDSDFNDPHHLNESGARKVSEIIAGECFA